MKFPLMAKIKQNFDTATIADIAVKIQAFPFIPLALILTRAKRCNNGW